jgi:hypothetical protein
MFAFIRGNEPLSRSGFSKHGQCSGRYLTETMLMAHPPEMIEHARLRPGPGFQLKRAAQYYCHRVVPSARLRDFITAGIVRRINRSQPEARGPVLPQSGQQLVRFLRDRGVTSPMPILTDDQLKEVHEFLAEQPLLTNRGQQLRTNMVPEGTRSAHYPLRAVLTCPNVLDVANHSSILGIVTRYLGCKPTISQIGLRWTFPSTTGAHDFTHELHRDYDDWKSVKLFVYLTDVDERSGPHVFVATSHRTSGRFRCSSYYALRDVEAEYGREQIVSVTAPRGSGFFADTFGIHKGELPLSGPRLLLGIQYSLLPNYSLVYNPMALPGPTAYDPYINRLLIAQPA